MAITARWPGEGLDPTDVCSHGHQLAPGSTTITVGELPNGRPDVKLLRNHVLDVSAGEFRPHGHPNTGFPQVGCEACADDPRWQ